MDELALEDDADEEDEAGVMSMSSVAEIALEGSGVQSMGAVPEEPAVEALLLGKVVLVTARGVVPELGASRLPGSTLRIELRIPMVRRLVLFSSF